MGVAEWSLLVAILALIAAGVAVWVALRTDRRAARQLALDTERRDVVWAGSVNDKGELWLRNDGLDPALDVHVDADVWIATGSPRVRSSLRRNVGRVEPGTEGLCEVLPEIAAEFAREAKARFVVGLGSRTLMSYSIHVTWRSPLGYPGSCDLDYSPFRR